LINKDLSSKESDILPDTEKSYRTDPKLKILSITVDRENKENIELVPQKAAAGYLNGFADPEYLEQLPKFQLPMLPSYGTYRAFEIAGDSMLPLQPGTIVIGRYIEDLNDVLSSNTYVLVTKKEGVVYKRVFKDDALAKFKLVSDNKIYDSFDVSFDEVMEIWEAKAYISLTFPDPEAAGEEMSIEKLKNIVLDLQHEVIKLKK
jgi:phage repressor protein C with HTH and peptisase S24 domain